MLDGFAELLADELADELGDPLALAVALPVGLALVAVPLVWLPVVPPAVVPLGPHPVSATSAAVPIAASDGSDRLLQFPNDMHSHFRS